MMGTSHCLIAIGISAAFHRPIGECALAGLGGLLPDIDGAGEILRPGLLVPALRFLDGPLTWCGRKLFGGHRGATHGLPIWAAAGIACPPLAGGAILHVLADMLGMRGVAACWPLSQRRWNAGIMRVDSVAEHLIVGGFLCLCSAKCIGII